MPLSLKPEDRISHYRVVSPLGVGGMGEVYRAIDLLLERDVALKVLPPELVRNEERVRRFTLEAKSASSLSHPHIVTIYEIGEDRVRGEGISEPSSGSLHYIAMELVQGKTFSAKIHEDRAELKALLGWLAQAAEGVAKAHAAGIVHRDLKPGNIMVSGDGYAKVLDFGLAKLTEQAARDPALSAAPTVTAREQTTAGAMLGTVGYMAPEQVRGQGVDARADVFAFGCMLYEAATRRRPFAAESNVETLHRILHDAPAPVEELNPEAPAELRRLIRRCLAKDPAQRPDSMRTLALELREIVVEYDALSASSSGSGTATHAMAAPAWRTRRVLAVVVPILLVGIAVALWALTRWPMGRSPSLLASMEMTTITSRGDVHEVALSPDGRYIAFTAGPIVSELWLRQLQTGTDVKLLGAQDADIVAPRFSSDGNYVFYTLVGPGAAAYRISSLGGAPSRVAVGINPPVEPAPDGKRIAFVRGIDARKLDALMLLDLASGEERVLSSVNWPSHLWGQVSWSANGKLIAGIEITTLGGRTRAVVARVADGRLQPLGPDSLERAPRPPLVTWLKSNRGLLIEGSPIRLLDYPSGRIRPITSDPNDYWSLSLSSDGETMAAVSGTEVTNLWVWGAVAGGAVRPLTTASNGQRSVVNAFVTPDGSILFLEGPQRTFRRLQPDGSGMTVFLGDGHGADGKPLAFGSMFGPGPDGGLLFSRRDSQGVGWLSRANANGDSIERLLDLPAYFYDVSANGEWMLFVPREGNNELWAQRVDGGKARRVSSLDPGTIRGSLSPDGSFLALTNSKLHVLDVTRTSDGAPVVELRPFTGYDLEWSSNGKFITFVNEVEGVGNVYRWWLDARAPRVVTHFRGGRILDHEWSPSRRLALVREHDRVTTLWMTEPDASHPVQLARFDVGSLFSVDWLVPESRGLLLMHRQEHSDAILIRNFH